MSILDANVRTNGKHDFYQTLPCQIKCLCQYLDLNGKNVLDAGAGKHVIANQLLDSFPLIKLDTSEINNNNPETDVFEFNFLSEQLTYAAEKYHGIKQIIHTNRFPKSTHGDFFEVKKKYDFIISNPPYSLKDEFIEHALKLATDVFMLFPLQILNYIEVCEKWLDNDLFCGKILMYPKVILNSEGEYIQGGNTGYAWFHWSNKPIKEGTIVSEKYEIIEDIRRYK